MSQKKIMIQDEIEDEIIIDLSELFMMLWSKIHIILLGTILAAVLAVTATKFLLTPKYTSTTRMYVLSRQNGKENVTYSDLQTGTQLLKDYMELVKSRPVLEQVISKLDLDMGVGELAGMIMTESKSDTRIFSISVESADPIEAKEIADALREAVGIQITKIMDADVVNTVEEGNLPGYPSSPNLKKNTIIGGIAGLFFTIGIMLLIFILDDTIKTPDDVEHFLGLNVLTSIPITVDAKKTPKARGIDKKQSIRNMKR